MEIPKFLRRTAPQIGMGIGAEGLHFAGSVAAVEAGKTGFNILQALAAGASITEISRVSLHTIPRALLAPVLKEVFPRGLSFDIFGVLGIAASAATILLSGGYQTAKIGVKEASTTEKDLYNLSRLLVPFAYAAVALAGVTPVVGLAASAFSFGMTVYGLRNRK